MLLTLKLGVKVLDILNIKCVLIVEYFRIFLVQFLGWGLVLSIISLMRYVLKNIDHIVSTFKNVVRFFISRMQICREWLYIGNRLRFTFLFGMQSIEG